LGLRSEAGFGLAFAVPLLGASLEFAFLEPDLVYAAKGWALVVGARLKLGGVRKVQGKRVGFAYSFAFCVFRVCLVGILYLLWKDGKMLGYNVWNSGTF
jgi:hypothetical protein